MRQIVTAFLAGTLLLGGLALVQPAEAQRYPRNRSAWGDWDRDGIPNRQDRDDDNDGIRDNRDRNDYSPLRYRYSYRYDWDRDGVPNSRDRYPRDPRRR